MLFENQSKLIKLLSAITGLEVSLMTFIFSQEFHEKWPETRKIFDNNEIEPLFEKYPDGLLTIEEEGELNMIKGTIKKFLKDEPRAMDLDILSKRVNKFQQELFDKFLKLISVK